MTRPWTGKSRSQTETTAVDPVAFEGRISVLPWEISSCLGATGAGRRERPPTKGPLRVASYLNLNRLCFTLCGSSSICVVALAVSRTAEDHLS